MANIKDILVHLLDAYNKPSESKTRLTKLIYLCDWKFALEYGRQMTHIRWKFDNFGPFVWDVVETVEQYDQVFSVRMEKSIFGSDKMLISLNKEVYETARLSVEEQKVLQFVMESTKGMGWSEFIKLVYSTYPIIMSDRSEQLNLIELAEEYKESPFYKNVEPEKKFGDAVKMEITKIEIESEEEDEF